METVPRNTRLTHGPTPCPILTLRVTRTRRTAMRGVFSTSKPSRAAAENGEVSSRKACLTEHLGV